MTGNRPALFFASFAAALAATPVAARAGAAEAGWRQWSVSRASVSIALPRTWVEYNTAGRRAVFTAGAPGTPYVGVTISVTPRRGDSFEQMVSAWLPSLRAARLNWDPKARITAKRVRLAVGTAELATTATIGDKASRTPVVVREYALLHKGRGYVLSFQCKTRDSVHYSAIFAKAADSVRFTR